MRKLITVILFVTMIQSPSLADEVYARSGSHALEVNLNNNATWNGPWQYVPVDRGKDYICKIWSKGTGEISLQIKDSNWNLMKKISVNSSADWVESSITFNALNFDRIILALIDSNATGKLYLDDFYLGLAEGGPNLVHNPSFESYNFAWTTAKNFTIVKGGGSGVPFSPLIVDTFGQLSTRDFPEKITNDQQLIDTVKWDKEYYNGLTVPADRDQYGGLLGSKEQYGLTATGYFQLNKLGDKWTMVTPDGNIFFSLGINGVGYVGDTYTNISGIKDLYEWIPEKSGNYTGAFHGNNSNLFSHYVANLVKKYGKAFNAEEYAAMQLERIKKWGFNTAGPISSMQMDNDIPIIANMPMPTIGRIGSSRMYDVFRDNWETEVENAAKDWLIKYKDSKWIVAYHLVNEPRYTSLEAEILAQKASTLKTKGKLCDMLKGKYANVAAFNSAWNVSYASMDDLYEATDLTVKTSQARADFSDFKEVYFERYYKVCNDVFRRYDPNHLLGTDRYMTSTTDDVELIEIIYTAAAKYVDLLTFNNYRTELKMDSIKRLYNIGQGKPIMLTEFSYSDTSRGIRPFPICVPTPEIKGSSYRNYVEQYAASGMVVGTHWFLYLDESVTGRHYEGINGESFAMGLIDVTDRPYISVVTAMKETNDRIYNVILGEAVPYKSDYFEVAPSENNDVLLISDFESTDTTSWSTSDGTWGIKNIEGNNVYEQSVSTEGTTGYAFAGDANWSGYTLECEATVTSFANTNLETGFNILVGVKDSDPAKYNYLLRYVNSKNDGSTYQILKSNNDYGTVIGSKVSAPAISAGETYILKGVFYGNGRIEFWVNNVKVIAIVDDNTPYEKGRIGLQARRAAVQFDNVKVTKLKPYIDTSKVLLYDSSNNVIKGTPIIPVDKVHLKGAISFEEYAVAPSLGQIKFIGAIYDRERLYDLAYTPITYEGGAYKANCQLKTPPNVSQIRISGFIWDAESIKPLSPRIQAY